MVTRSLAEGGTRASTAARNSGSMAAVKRMLACPGPAWRLAPVTDPGTEPGGDEADFFPREEIEEPRMLGRSLAKPLRQGRSDLRSSVWRSGPGFRRQLAICVPLLQRGRPFWPDRARPTRTPDLRVLIRIRAVSRTSPSIEWMSQARLRTTVPRYVSRVGEAVSARRQFYGRYVP